MFTLNFLFFLHAFSYKCTVFIDTDKVFANIYYIKCVFWHFSLPPHVFGDAKAGMLCGRFPLGRLQNAAGGVR